MISTHLCYKIYHVWDRLGEVQLIIVKAYIQVVPAMQHDLLSVRGLNKAGYAVNHHPDPDSRTICSVCCDQQQDRQIQIISINE
jgi:hypothetical protein